MNLRFGLVGFVALASFASCSKTDNANSGEASAVAVQSHEANTPVQAEWVPPPSLLTLSRLKDVVGVHSQDLVEKFGPSTSTVGYTGQYYGVIGGSKVGLTATMRDGLSRRLTICTTNNAPMTVDRDLVPLFMVRGDQYWIGGEPPCVEIRSTELPTGELDIRALLGAKRTRFEKAMKRSFAALGKFKKIEDEGSTVYVFSLWGVAVTVAFDPNDQVLALVVTFDKWVDVPGRADELRGVFGLDGDTVRAGKLEFAVRFRKDQILGFERTM